MILLFIQDAIAQSLDPANLETANQAYTAIGDSIMPIVKDIHESIHTIAQNTHPAPYTIESLGISKWGLYIGILSAILAGIGALYSYRTASSVKRINKNTQENLLVDLIRHLHRNEICTLAFIAKWKKNPGQYPADEHLLKLQTLPEDIHMERYNSKPEHYEKMHELSLLLRNYNTEIEVAHKHLLDPHISQEVKMRDLDTLIFKPAYIINRLCENAEIIIGKKINKERANIIMLSQHFKILKDNYNANVWAYKGDVELLLDVKTENWIDKLIVKETDEKRNRKEKKELLKRYAACLDIARRADSEFTEKDLVRLNELNEIEQKKKERKEELGTDEKEELNKLRINHFQTVMAYETKCCAPDKLKWNDLNTMLRTLTTDVIIEYSKIGMIDYPVQAEIQTPGYKKDKETGEDSKVLSVIISILSGKVAADRISTSKTSEYLAVKLDNKNICQVYLNGSKKYFKIKDANNKWTRIDIRSVDDIRKYAGLIEKSVEGFVKR